MRNVKAVLFGATLIVGLLGGPAATSVAAAAAPQTIYSNWTCDSGGSGTEGTTTTTSTVLVYADHSQDRLNCYFKGYSPADGKLSFSFGGACSFDIPQGGGTITFSHRTWFVLNGNASLTCWDGTLQQNT